MTTTSERSEGAMPRKPSIHRPSQPVQPTITSLPVEFNDSYKVAAAVDAALKTAPDALLAACDAFLAFGKAGGDTSWQSKDAQQFFYAMMVACGEAKGGK